MKKFILSVFVMLFTTGLVLGQGLTPYEWKQYHLSFKVPGGANILKSTSDEFEVDNDVYNVAIAVVKLPLDDDDMSSFLIEKSKQEGMLIENAEVQTFNNTGVHGVSLEGKRNGGDNMCTVVLVTENTHTFIFISIIYADGHEHEATDMVNSFMVKA